MTDSSALAVTALLEAAAPDDWSRLFDSLGELLTSVARTAAPVPAPLVEHAFATGDAGLLRALTENTRALEVDPALHARLTASGHPAVLVTALTFSASYGGSALWPLDRQRAMLSRPGPDDPIWTDPEMRRILDRKTYIRRYETLVVCRAPGAVAAAFAGMQPMRPADNLRALVSVAEADGLDAVAKLLEEHDVPEVPRPLDLATLRAATERAEGTEGLIAELRDGNTYSLFLRTHIDWAALTAEHARKKFVKDVVNALTSRADCPVEATRALGDIPAVAAAGDHDWVVDNAVPAKNALKALWAFGVERLGHLVAEVLGDDPAAWRAMRVEITRHKGTITELFALVADRIRAGDLPDRPEPGDVPPPPPGGRLSLKIPDAAFLTLLDAATPEVRLALLPHLDGPAAHALLTQGRERIPEWTDHLIERGDTTLLTCLADDRRLSLDEVVRLMRLDVPEISHALGARHRDWPPRFATWCPDSALRTVILTKVHVRGEIPRLRILLDQWERHGRDGLPEMIKITVAQSGLPAFIAAIRKRIEKLLAQEDETAALAELRAHVEAGESAAGQIALLRKASAKYKSVGTEHHDWHWADIQAEHEREPFADRVIWDLTRGPGCPAELRALADGMVHHWETDAEAAIAAGKEPVEVLAEHKLEEHNARWIRRLLNSGHLTWDDVLAHAGPAQAALALVAADDGAAETRGRLTALVTEHLGTSPDTWQLAIAMLADFTGSPEELLRTASLMVRGT